MNCASAEALTVFYCFLLFFVCCVSEQWHEHVYSQKSGMSELITCSKSKKPVTCSLIILSQWFFVTLDSLYKLWTLFVPLSSADAILEIPENQWETFLCADVIISNLRQSRIHLQHELPRWCFHKQDNHAHWKQVSVKRGSTTSCSLFLVPSWSG